MFWFTILLVSTGCLYLLLMPVVLRANDVAFTPDTLYLDWQTTFPAVTVCETYNPKMAQRKFAQLFPNLTASLNYDYRRYVTELLYGQGTCTRSVCVPCGDQIPCDLPWRDIVRDVRLKCSELLLSCRFNTKKFSCCNEFMPVDSEYGPCYAFNSLQRRNTERNSLFVVNKTSGPGILSFELKSTAQISIHSTEELSTDILDKKFKFDVKIHELRQMDIRVLFRMVEVDNEPLVVYEDVNVRKCRYTDEIPSLSLHTYPVYSYGACRLAMDTEKLLNYCGCIHPVRDNSYSGKYCNYTGLNCLVSYKALKIKQGIDAKPDLDDCLPSCEESELTIVHVSRIRPDPITDRRDRSLMNIKMSSLPSIRYRKDLLRTNLDLAVSVGGMLGLFFSASIISIAEVFYLILRAPVK